MAPSRWRADDRDPSVGVPSNAVGSDRIRTGTAFAIGDCNAVAVMWRSQWRRA